MKRRLLIIVGALLAAAAVSAISIVTWEHFRPGIRPAHEAAARTPMQTAPAAQTAPTAQTGPSGPGRAGGMREELRRGTVLPLAHALDIATQHLPGEVLKVELESKHGRRLYEIKVLAANGRVREIKLDATSGALIEIEDD